MATLTLTPMPSIRSESTSSSCFFASSDVTVGTTGTGATGGSPHSAASFPMMKMRSNRPPFASSSSMAATTELQLQFDATSGDTDVEEDNEDVFFDKVWRLQAKVAYLFVYSICFLQIFTHTLCIARFFFVT